MKKRFVAIMAIIALLIVSYGCNSEQENPYAPIDEPESPLVAPENPIDDALSYELDDRSEESDVLPEDETDGLDYEVISEPEEIPNEVVETVIECISEVDAELFEQLNSAASRFNAAAVSLAVFDGEHHFFTYQFGYANISERRPVDVETKFRSASLSKITTAIVVMILVERGLICLDEDISVYFGFTVRNPSHPDVPITPRMLMQHTSSIIDSGTFLSSRAALGTGRTSTLDLLEMRSSFAGRSPGRGHIYSNLGFSVLGAMSEIVSSMSFDALARELLFEPLGIDAAYLPMNLIDTENIAGIYNANRGLSRSVTAQLNVGTSGVLGHDHHLAQGNLTISALDYARILAMLVSGGALGDVRILSEESVYEIHYADVAAGAFKQGLAVRFQESGFLSEDIFWHTGSSVGEFAQFVYCSKTNRGVVILTTGAPGDRLPNGMVRACTELAELVWNIGVRDIVISNISDIDIELSYLLDGIASDFNSVSVSIAAFNGVYDFYTYQFGYAEVAAQRLVDVNTKFRVASLSKYVTAMLVMALVESGEIDLDEDISVYLGYDVRNPNFPDVPITARMLLQHTSSIVDADAYLTARFSFGRTTAYNLLRTRSMFSRHAPGTQFEYTDFGFIVLGAICEAVSGMLLDDLAKEIIFEPLGIDAAFAAMNLESRNIAAIYNRNHRQNRSVQAQLNHNPRALGFEHNLAQGGLMISALDYAKILAMLSNGGELGHVRILSEESVNEIHIANVHTRYGYSQGLAVRFQSNAFLDYDVFWHTGSAHGLFAQFVYCPDTVRGVVVLTTGTAGERFPNGMVRVCTLLAEHVWGVGFYA